MNSNPKNTNQSETTRKRRAKDSSTKVVEKQQRNDIQQIKLKGIFA